MMDETAARLAKTFNDFWGDPTPAAPTSPYTPEQEAAIDAAFDAQQRAQAARARYQDLLRAGRKDEVAVALQAVEAARAEYIRLADLAPPLYVRVHGEQVMRTLTAHEQAVRAEESRQAERASRARAEYDLEAEGRD